MSQDNNMQDMLVKSCMEGDCFAAVFLADISSRKGEIDNPDSNGVSPLCGAVIRRRIDLARWLIDCSGADVNKLITNYPQLLIQSCCTGHMDEVKFLVEDVGYNINEVFWGIPIIAAALYKKQKKVVKYLIDKGVDLEVKFGKENLTPSYMIKNYHSYLFPDYPELCMMINHKKEVIKGSSTIKLTECGVCRTYRVYFLLLPCCGNKQSLCQECATECVKCPFCRTDFPPDLEGL